MIIVIEGLILCVLLVLYCLIGIRNGAVGLVHLYEKDVQERAIELGLTTSQKIKKNGAYFKIIGLVMYFVYAIICVYVINGADNFMDSYIGSISFNVSIYCRNYDAFAVITIAK